MPDWFLKPHEIWLDAMNYCHPVTFHSHLSTSFWGSNEQKQRTYYHHFFVLHHAIRQQVSCLPPLTTQEWRSVLRNTYWKQQWPKPNGSVPSQDSTFDPNVFWSQMIRMADPWSTTCKKDINLQFRCSPDWREWLEAMSGIWISDG
ncbi:hypothetical protein BJY52DRAFT_1228087 [Lactarius psammicola]|nr:hypothetical protein BJY52DRAFT_1228087 [Lactarius psammicola]